MQLLPFTMKDRRRTRLVKTSYNIALRFFWLLLMISVKLCYCEIVKFAEIVKIAFGQWKHIFAKLKSSGRKQDTVVLRGKRVMYLMHWLGRSRVRTSPSTICCWMKRRTKKRSVQTGDETPGTKIGPESALSLHRMLPTL